MSFLRIVRRLPFSVLGVLLMVLLSSPLSGRAETIEQQCRERFTSEMLNLRTAYRTVQYGDLSREPPWSLTVHEQLRAPLQKGILRGGKRRENEGVLGTEATRTSTLVPYLVENLRGLSCRLQQVCLTAKDSLLQGNRTNVLPTRPLGCSRLSFLRNRFYVAHPLRGHPVQFPECAPVPGELDDPAKEGVTTKTEIGPLFADCRSLSDRVLAEEEAMLKSVVAYDVMQRGLRQIFTPLQSLLSAVTHQLVAPVRMLVESLGTLHAIPCLQPHCD